MISMENEGYVQTIRKYLGDQKIILNASGGIILKDNQILLQRRKDNNKWGFPGGLLELNETYLDAAIREIKEETGLNVKPIYFLGIYHNYDMEWQNKDKAHVISALYVFNIISGDLEMDFESNELKFFSIDAMPELFAEDHICALKAFKGGIHYPIPEENKRIL